MSIQGKVVLVLNAGSSSLKYAVYVVYEDGTCVFVVGGQFDFGQDGMVTSWKHAGKDQHVTASMTRTTAVKALVELFGTPNAAVHRVVMTDEDLLRPFRITPSIVARLEKYIPIAPLHQGHNIRPMYILAEHCPSLLQIGSADNGFLGTIIKERRRLAVSEQWHDRGVRMWGGWHGHSYAYVAERLRQSIPHARRIVIAHVGAGASACAIEDGKAVDATMTFSPLDGMPGATRSGSLDPAAVLYMFRTLAEQQPQLSVHEVASIVERDLWKSAGLLGISGTTGDMRMLLKSSVPRDVLAVEVFCTKVAEQITKMVVSLGGIDALAFTAGIGANSPPVRELVVKKLAFLDFALDIREGGANALNAERIESYGKPILAMQTDEEVVMAKAAVPFLYPYAAAAE